MRLRFLKTIVVDVETRDGEIYDKAYSRWTEIKVDEVYDCGGSSFVTIKLDNGDIIHAVPVNSFEQLKEEKKIVSI